MIPHGTTSNKFFLPGIFLVSAAFGSLLVFLKLWTQGDFYEEFLALLLILVYYASLHYTRTTYLLAITIIVGVCVCVIGVMGEFSLNTSYTMSTLILVSIIISEFIYRAANRSRIYERCLIESEDLYRNAIKAAAAVPYYLDLQRHQYTLLGDEIQNLIGYDTKLVNPDLLGSITEETILVGDMSRLSIEEAIQLFHVADDVRWQSEYRVRTGTGEERWLSDSAVQVKDESGVRTIGSFGILSDITARKQAEIGLRKSEQAEREFREQLRLLLEASNTLAAETSFDGLCRKAVDVAREKFDLDRVSLWFLAPDDPGTGIGAFGTDESGRTRDERGARFPFTMGSFTYKAIADEAQIELIRAAPLYNHMKEIVGHGDRIYVAVRDASRVVGFISVDNLVRSQPFTQLQCDVLMLYATTVGHLCSLVKAKGS